jgi:hypothetical protein
VFDLKAEPTTYEEIVARARYVRAKLGITTAPKPVTIQSCPPPPKPVRIQKPRITDKPPTDLRPLSDRAREVMRSKEMQRFVEANYEKSYKSIDWLFDEIERWVAVLDEPRPAWANRIIRQFCEEHGVPAVVLFSHSRIPEIVDLRCALWARLHEASPQPGYSQIGRWFKRDHSSVLYGVKRYVHGEADPYVAKKFAAHKALARRTREERREALKASIQAWDASKWAENS